MNNTERYEYFMSRELHKATQIELLDWAGYWTMMGLDPIEDPLQREQARKAIERILSDGGQLVEKVARLAISEDAIKEAPAGEVTEAIVHTVIVGIMARKLEWLTGIRELTVS